MIISPFVLLPACYQSRTTLYDWAYYFDNEEDGFDGGKGAFYGEYLDVDIRSQHWLKRAWIAYKWSVWRNPCFNLRYHPKISYDIQDANQLEFEGNTYHHEQRYSFEPSTYGLKWYKLSGVYVGRKAKSWFYLVPIGFNSYLYIRFGLKLYPANYFDEYWLDKIKADGWPEHKDKGIIAATIRIRKAA